ncbi:MAG: tRNA (adenosine(37)-N6)-dimethylallyltransferase MiaA [Bacilli bacterium]
MQKVIVITGPTGVGKTKLSIEIAKRYNGEIINGDAIQIYKGMDIGSAKIKEEEMEGIKHHLFSIKDVSEDYSIYNYQVDCREKIKEIQDMGKVAIIVGGTGLYIKSALFDYTLDSEKKNIDNEYKDVSTEELYKRLKLLDKDIQIDKFNRRRVIRALNYYLENNKSIKSNDKGNKLLYDTLFIGLTCDREILYKRIDDRVDMMIKNGLLEEVKSFYDRDVRTKPLLSGIGYKELYKYFDNEIDYDEAIRLIKRNSRRYAKRQYTFFNNQFKINWFMTDFDNFDKTICEVCNYIDKKGND